jgi:hypothetical protein
MLALVRRLLDAGVRRLALTDEPERVGLDRAHLSDRSIFLERGLPEEPWTIWSGSVEMIVATGSTDDVPKWCVETPADAVRILLVPEDSPDPDRPDRPLRAMHETWSVGSMTVALRRWLS